MSNTTPVHISVILDRSGSMASIADDIVGGFNTFLEQQRKEDGEARITLVQFDGGDPFEVLVAGEDLDRVADLDPNRYIPRGNTPLWDAVGRMIARIDGEIGTRADAGEPIEDQLVLIVTDGFENASMEFDGQTLARLIAARKKLGWTFVFLGSDESTFAEGERMNIAMGSTKQWNKSAEGSRAMFASMSHETSEFRKSQSEQRRLKSEKFFEDEPGTSGDQ
ncbi:MAG: vWA domain-containing protein [Acidimicrobiia bacterium]